MPHPGPHMVTLFGACAHLGQTWAGMLLVFAKVWLGVFLPMATLQAHLPTPRKEAVCK